MKNTINLILLFTFGFSIFCSAQKQKPRVLIFSKTVRYYHQSIPAGIEAIIRLGEKNGFEVDTTKDAAFFTEDVLKNYAAVIWLSTTGDVLNPAQQAYFERYIQSGGGYVGIHSASASEKQWDWFGKLTGAVFVSHPPDPVAGIIKVTDRKDPSTKQLPQRWQWKDEWYNFNKRNSEVHVLFTADETTYKGGTEGPYHPLAWKHEFDGGRSFYTALGHLSEGYSDPLFQKHILEGIKYAVGKNARLDYSKAKTAAP